MTKLLKKAFQAAEKLSKEQQDALAAMMLDEIESDEHWEASFEASHNELEALAQEALEEHRQGRTQPLEPDAL